MTFDLARIREVTKAIAGASAAGLGSVTTTFIIVPPEIVMPWFGYVIVGLANASLTFGLIYLAPRNKEPTA